jgi:hypothetical protein
MTLPNFKTQHPPKKRTAVEFFCKLKNTSPSPKCSLKKPDPPQTWMKNSVALPQF